MDVRMGGEEAGEWRADRKVSVWETEVCRKWIKSNDRKLLVFNLDIAGYVTEGG